MPFKLIGSGYFISSSEQGMLRTASGKAKRSPQRRSPQWRSPQRRRPQRRNPERHSEPHLTPNHLVEVQICKLSSGTSQPSAAKHVTLTKCIWRVGGNTGQHGSEESQNLVKERRKCREASAGAPPHRTHDLSGPPPHRTHNLSGPPPDRTHDLAE